MNNVAVSTDTAASTRWTQLVLGFIVMMAISSPQYVWTLFVKPFQTTTGGTLAAVQVTFSILIVLQTWLAPIQGWLIDRFGPKLLITFGAALSGLGWVTAAHVTNISMSASSLSWCAGSRCAAVSLPVSQPPAMVSAPWRRRFRSRI
jgi:OFA family oxalate/formate antiporter-like MFS transporter